MISTNNLSLQYGKRVLFKEVNLKFTRGNCYGIIGANGAGKSTFLKILSGEIDPTRGSMSILPGNRMAVLKQNHFEYEEEEVLNTVIMGHKQMYDIMQEKDAIYMNPDATEEDGLRAADLENEFGEMGGWTAESDAAELLSNLGVKEHLHYKLLKELTGADKVKVLLAQALFGNPDILLLDEPTNDLDAKTISWLANFLADFKNTVIVVSHDRYFLDMVCTHVVDIDYAQMRIFTGNYTFWYESSKLMRSQLANKNKKIDQKRKELQEFVARFSANASKSRQATSRKKALEKLNLEEVIPSSRKFPYIHFDQGREAGNLILNVKDLSYQNDKGEYLFKNVTFEMSRGDKIAVVSDSAGALTAFYEVLSGKLTPTTGEVAFGQTITFDYLPNNNEEFFMNEYDMNLIEWLRQFAITMEEKEEQFLRTFLGRMLFSGDEVYKKSSVLSGGEKVRCMLSKMMLAHPNFLLMDEPTSHLDLEAIMALNNGLTDYKGSLIFSSHDYQLMQTVANRIIELKSDGMIDKLGTYKQYLEFVEAQKEEIAA